MRKRNWKDYFQKSYLSQKEYYHSKSAEVTSTEKSQKMTSVETNDLGEETMSCNFNSWSEVESSFCEISTQEAFDINGIDETKFWNMKSSSDSIGSHRSDEVDLCELLVVGDIKDDGKSWNAQSQKKRTTNK